jgi:hypothetical protein
MHSSRCSAQSLRRMSCWPQSEARNSNFHLGSLLHQMAFEDPRGLCKSLSYRGL